MIQTHELDELRLLGLIDAAAPTDEDVARAVAKLGTWLCPRADADQRREAARAYLGQHGQRYAARSVRMDSPALWTVSGVVHRAALAGTGVEVHAISVAGDAALVGSALVGASGAYAVAVAGTPPPVIEVRVTAAGAVVGTVGPLRAQAAQWVAWCEPGAAPARDGKFEVQRRWLGQLAGGARARDEALAAHSGVSVDELRRHRWADALAPELGGNAALTWALLALCGWCTEAETLDEDAARAAARAAVAAAAPADVRVALERAFAERLVATAHRADADAAIAAHRALRRDAWLALRAHPEASTWGELLGVAGLGATHLDRVPGLFEHALDDVFANLLAADALLPATARARLAWAKLVRHDHAALARAGDDAPPAALARHAPAELAARVTDDAAHRAEIVTALEAHYPGHAVLWHLRDELGDGARALYDAGLLDLERLTVALWEGAHPGDNISAARGTGAPIPAVSAEARAALMTHQRLLRVGLTKIATIALARAGFDSAHAIAETSPAELAAAVAPHGVGAAEAVELHARAVARQRAATSLYLDSVAARRTAPTASAAPATAKAAAGEGETMQALTAAPLRIPTLATLFGPLDSCECEDCESVTSPSAYLVDQLLWLAQAKVAHGSAYATLVARRPDLPQIELTCAGSETAVPHIDLACELLEDQLATALGVARVERRQTIGTAAEIRAYPEHLNPAVYAKLADPAVFPWPFDPYLAELRGYLAQLRSSRAAVLAAFGDRTGPEAAAEALGISVPQRTVLARAAADDTAQTAIWGRKPAEITMDDLLRRGEALLGAPLPYAALVEVLGSTFVAAGRTVAIQLTPDPSDPPGTKVDHCRADQRTVAYAAAGTTALAPLDAAVLDRLHRALRLAAALGWDLRATCAVLAALAPTGLDATVLDRLAIARGSAARLGLSALDVAACYGSFSGPPGAQLDALFRSLFPPDRPLTGSLGTLAAPLGAALGIAPADAAALVAALGLGAAAVGRDTLAQVVRHVRVAEALGLAPADYLARRALIGDPFGGGDPLALRGFLDADALLAAVGVDDAQLRALLTTADEPAAAVAALAAALGAARTRRPDVATADAFLAAGLWREPLAAWLALPGAAAAAALDAIAAQIAGPLRAVIAWAFLAGAPPPGDALRALRRFGRLYGAASTAPDLVPGRANPALATFVTAGSWSALAAYLRFTAAGAGALAPARALFAAAPAAEPLAAALGVTAADAAALVAQLPAGTLAEQWLAVAHRLELARATKLPPAALLAAAAPPSEAVARALRDAYQASVPRDAWLATSAAVQNALRPVRRDALVAALLAKTGVSAREASDFALNDVLTGEGRDRTRVGEACAAIQTFVNRISLGLEPEVVRQDDRHWAQWAWRKRYALWKGNRMVFLFPENYLSAGKRPRTSPLFTAFQDTIARAEITEDNVSAALVAYLDGLTEISDLEYLAVGSDYDSNDDTEFSGMRTLSVVGRTRGAPGRYYFSTLEDGGWSPFEELKLGEDPSHVALYSGAGAAAPQQSRHILVWPKSTLMPRPDQATTTPTTGAVTPARMVLATKYAWTERHGASDWSPPRTTSHALLYDGATLTQRQMLLSLSTVGAAQQGEFQIATHCYKPAPAGTTGDNAREPSLVGAMFLRRDTTDKQAIKNAWANVNVVQTSAADPASWSGAAPADELREQHLSTRQIEASTGSALARGKRPWVNLRYDQNRMVAAVAPGIARVAPLVTPFDPVTTLLAPSTPYAVTVLPWRNKGELPFPSAWALFASGASWSFFIVQKDTFPDPTSPDPTMSGKRALGLGSENFGKTQRFAAVPAYHPYAAKLLAFVKDRGLPALYSRVVQRRPAEALAAPARSYKVDLGVNTDDVFVPSSERGAASPIESIDFSGLSPHANYNVELFVFAPLVVANLLRARGRHAEAQRFFHHVFNPLEGPVDAANGKPWWITPAFDSTADITLDQIMSSALAPNAPSPYATSDDDPFDAHAIAFGRRSAYQRYTVMEYVRNLLEWGDTLYAQLDLEDLDEAGQLYGLAASILGEPPLAIPPAGGRAPRTFGSPADWAASGNVLVPLENLLGAVPATGAGGAVALPLHTDGANRLYFSIPRNDTLVGFYARVAQSLANLRTVKSLGLNTTVDIQALVNAAAAGRASLLDALAPGGQRTLGPRFRVLVAKALELCGEARALCAAVQSAGERQDAEHLAAVRSTWEGRVFDVARVSLTAKKLEAQREIDALQAARDATVARRDYYASRQRMSDGETAAFDLNVAGAVLADIATGLDIAATAATVIPDFTIGASGAFASPVATAKIGGTNIGGGLQQAAHGVAAVGLLVDRRATMVATQAGYDRRFDDWQFQAVQARLELDHLDAQLTAARVRVQIADAELATQARQRQAWAEQDDFLRTKYTNEDLYLWLLEQTHQLHVRVNELAMDLADRAKAAFQFELPDAPEPALRHTWDAAKRGALAADQLAFSLRQMEADHLAFDRHDFTIVRRLSLKQLAPAQLLALRRPNAQGTACTIPVPAWWLDRLDPGLHHRRVHSVAVSVPCLAGPSASVNATFSFAGVAQNPLTSIRLATGVNDRGGDPAPDRYAPFEGISLDADTTWHVAFPPHTDVDPSTIADVIVAIEYTADRGTGDLPPPVTAWTLHLDLERDAPLAWQALVRALGHAAQLDVRDYLPAVVSELRTAKSAKLTALDAQGVAVTGIAAHAAGAAVQLDGAAMTGDWAQVASVVVEIEMVAS